MQVWNVLHADRWKCRTQKIAKKSPSGTIAQICRAKLISSQLRHIYNRKKTVKQQYLLHMSAQYGELQPTSGWDPLASLGHPSPPKKKEKINGFRVLAALLHDTPVLGVSQTLRRWTEGATIHGGHHVGHWPTFLIIVNITFNSQK